MNQDSLYQTLSKIQSAMEEHIVGQSDLIQKIIIAIFSGGHILLEWVPWTGKTKTIHTLAQVLWCDFNRISFTPDLLPSDLVGVEIYEPNTAQFSIRKGPIFTQILLADEINRTPPKVQSALLEAMQENSVTIAETTFELPYPFFVFATQNPLEHEWTYPLPEAQLDRFFMRIVVEHPTKNDEKQILLKETQQTQNTNITKIVNHDNIIQLANWIKDHIHVDEKIFNYVCEILENLREKSGFEWSVLQYGPSSRAGIALIRGARVRAVIHQRDFVMPEDIKAIAHEILDHRMGLSYESLSEGIQIYDITEQALEEIIIPD